MPPPDISKLYDDGGGPKCCKDKQASGTDSTQTSTPPPPTPCEKQSGEPIGVSSGYLTDSRLDISIPGRMVAGVVPYFHSDLEYMGHLGFGWSSVLGVRLFHWPDSSWSLRDHWGRREDFSSTGVNTSKRFYAGNLDLSSLDSVRIRIDRDHVYAFDRIDGVLLRIRDDRGAHVDLQYEMANLVGSQPGAGPSRRKYPIRGVSNYAVPRGLRATIAMDYRVIALVDGDDATRRLLVAYDTSGQVASITDPTGRKTTYTYDYFGNASRVIFPDGTLRRFFWTDPVNIHRMTAFDAKPIRPSLASDTTILTRNTWDAIGRVTGQTWQGSSFAFQRAGYSSSTSATTNGDTLTTWTRATTETRTEPDGLGGTRRTVRSYRDLVVNKSISGVPIWDSRTEQVIQTVNGASDTTITRYNLDNSIASQTKSDGTTVAWSKNADGTVQTVTETPRAGHGPVRTTVVTLDAVGRVVRKEVSIPGVPPDVHTSTWASGSLVSDCVGDGTAALCSQRQYDSQNRLSKVADPAGVVTTYVYASATHMLPDSTTFADGTGESYVRDVLGRIVQTRNQLGQVATTAFDAAGRDTLSCAYDGACVRKVYDGPDLVRLEEGGTLSNGTFSMPLRVTKYVVDGYGRRVQELLQSGSRWVLKRKTAYDAFGNAVEIRDNPDSAIADSANWRLVERNLYDGRNFLVQRRTFPGGAGVDSLVTVYSNDVGGHILKLTDPRGAVVRDRFDAWGNVLADTNAVTGATRHRYDASNHPLADTNALDQVTTHAYDAQGHEVRRIGAHGDTSLWIYNKGRLAKERSPEGNWTNYAYDVRSRLVSVTRKVGDSASAADANDIVTTYSYDAVGHRHTETVAGAVQHRYGLDPMGRVLLDTNALGLVTQFIYDRLGRQSRQIMVSSDTLATDYDAQGRAFVRRLLSPGKPADTLSVTRYDDADRPVWERTPGSGAIAKVYDGSDYLKQTTDSVGIVTTFTQDRDGRDSLVGVAGKTPRKTVRDAAGRVTQQSDERGYKVGMAYDALDRLTSLADNEGKLTTFTYVDSTGGWRRTTTYPDSKTESHFYDREGRLRRFLDGRGISTTYRYDSLSRLAGIRYLNADGSDAADSVVLRYDALSRLVNASRGAAADSTEYDVLGRPSRSMQTVDGTAYVLTYAYADTTRTRTLGLPDGSTVKQSWTARGMLDSLWSGSRLLARFGYASGLETSRVLGNGITETLGYDAAGRLSSRAFALTGQTLPSLGFAYDLYGNRSLIRRNHYTTTSEAMTYTADNQVSSWTKGTADASGVIASPTASQSWTLDSRGNWSSWTQTPGGTQARKHDAANELDTMGTTILTWDASGDLTSDGALTYVWGPRGTLDTVKQGATVKGFYGYDPLGRRALKTAGSLKTISIYDGWQCVWQKVTGSGTDTTKAFAYGNYIDEPVTMVRKWSTSTDTSYYLQGNNYNVEALTDRTGSVIERYEYSPYGKVTVYTGAGTDGKWFTADDVSATVSAKGNALTFQGRELDAESGNYFYRARSYSSNLGRFISRDPIRWDGGDINIFRGFSNAPLLETDPLGLFVRSVSLSLGEYGNISGQIASASDMSWNPPTGGVNVSLSYTPKNCKKCKDLRWKQTITTTDPTCGRTSPYVDNTFSGSCKDNGTQWYGGEARYLDGFSVSGQVSLKTSTGLQFVDAPSRQFAPKRTISWKASLEVWCLPSDGGAWFSAGGLTYGFSLSPRRWTIMEIK